jgi:hypothetical protein
MLGLLHRIHDLARRTKEALTSSVGTFCRVDRRNNGMPTRSSSVCITVESVERGQPNVSAAWVKLPLCIT